MRTFHLRIYEADGTFFEGEAEMVVVPTIDGEYGVMAYHENIVVSVESGILKYRPEGEEETLYASVSSGMMRVENNDVLILVDSAEHPDEIDETRAREEEEAAREAMLQKRSVQEYLMAEATLQRAVNRLKLKNKRR